MRNLRLKPSEWVEICRRVCHIGSAVIGPPLSSTSFHTVQCPTDPGPVSESHQPRLRPQPKNVEKKNKKVISSGTRTRTGTRTRNWTGTRTRTWTEARTGTMTRKVSPQSCISSTVYPEDPQMKSSSTPSLLLPRQPLHPLPSPLISERVSKRTTTTTTTAS